MKKTCEIHGEYEAQEVLAGNVRIFSRCPACESATNKAIEADEAYRKAQASQSNMITSGIPKKYTDSKISNLISSSEEHRKALLRAERYVAAFASLKVEGVSMIFFGTPGTGKTHLACAIAIGIIKQGFAAKYITAFDLLNEISDTFRTKESTRSVVDKYTGTDLLVLDEVGIQYGKDHDSIWIYKVINSRYVNNRPTIVISNLDQAELEAFLGAPTYDRLQEGKGAAIPFYWDSYRRKPNLKMAG